MILLRSWLWKRRKILRGLWNTRFRRHGAPYDSDSWWDEDFYVSGVSDRQTISPRKSAISSWYHYCSVEMLLLGYLFNRRVSAEGVGVLDLGSGSGHWIDFWLELGAGSVTGIDISETAAGFLREKYSSNGSVRILHGRSASILGSLEGRFGIVSAIGVMFHLVDDAEWSATLAAVADHLEPGGLFVVGGHFGMLDGIDVQIGRDGRSNKRLRSRRHWIRSLRSCGFREFRILRNHAYLGIRDTLPENHVLVAVKGAARAVSPPV